MAGPVRSWWIKLPSGGSLLVVPVRMIAGPLHSPHEVGPVLSDLLGGEPRLKWHIFDRTAHEHHGHAPFAFFVGSVGK